MIPLPEKSIKSQVIVLSFLFHSPIQKVLAPSFLNSHLLNFFEFLVIVMGISVSFWLNELSIEKNENRERLKVLNNIKTEIKDIQKYTADRMKYWQDDIDLNIKKQRE